MAQSQYATHYDINKIIGGNSENSKPKNSDGNHNQSQSHSENSNHSNTNNKVSSPKSIFNDGSKNSSEKSKKEAAEIQINNIIYQTKDQGAKQYQEDSTFLFCSEDLSFLVAGIFDGHGGFNGQIASNIVAKSTEQFFKANWKKCLQWNEEQWKQELTSLFDLLHNKIRECFIEIERNHRKNGNESTSNLCDEKGVVRKSSNFPVHGGTTATIVTVIRTEKTWKMVTANVGDSDALLLARKPTYLPKTNKNCKHLSVDHSPDSVSEYLRIKKLPTDKYPSKLLFVYDQNKTPHKYQCPLVFLEDGTKDPKYVKHPWNNELRPTNVRYDPAVYAVSPYGVKYDVTCIAMTRSLGDFYGHQFGLSYVPDITFNEMEIENCEYIITVGSDGIWDCWKWEEWSEYFNDLMTKHGDRLNIVVETALDETIKKAKSCFGDDSYDDASLVCIALRPELFVSRNIKNNNSEKNNNDNDSSICKVSDGNSTIMSHIQNIIKSKNENTLAKLTNDPSNRVIMKSKQPSNTSCDGH